MSAPQCIGIILDGNRRWAKREGLPALEGHRRGADRLIECVRWARDRSIKHLVVYAFSTENWNRMQEEVSYLMDLFRETAGRTLNELAKDNVRVRFIGKLEMLPEDLQDTIKHLEKTSASNSGITLWICMSYGSRAEIVAAANAAAREGEAVTEENFSKHLWSASMPDPALIVRTSGRHRLSNFLLWQAAYSELFFLDTLWPDFSEADLDHVLAEFARTQRNFGI
jgi:undecaprenyl diphosphate synthase